VNLGLAGKIVLVTGGSRGIGLACARVFAEEGARVAIASRDRRHLDEAQRSLRASGYDVDTWPADLRDAHAGATLIADVESTLGPLDVLVTSAGAARRYAPEALDSAAWHDTMDAKYFTTIHAVDPAIKRMAARRRGVIVNIIGQGGKVAGDHHIAGGAANAALMLATAGLAHAYARQGVRVVAINPGSTLTTRVDEALALEAAQQGITKDEARRRGEARIPLGRYADPEDIARMAAFLASEQASYVTATTIPMDGGSTPLI
jgi:NAD(P)-dependent dehydrogenase (short-subunit alcohol dehydrogenase family)